MGAADAKGKYGRKELSLYTDAMWDYEFQMHFAKWLHEKEMRFVLVF